MAVMVIICGAVPFAGATINQGESLPVEKLSVPLPEFVTLTICGAGSLAIPSVPVNDSIVCDRPSTGPPPFPPLPPPLHPTITVQANATNRSSPIRFIFDPLRREAGSHTHTDS